jgi:transposase
LAADDVVVMDNLAAHKVFGVQEAITAAGASILYLPPYSPDLNPSSARRRMIRSPKERRPGGRRGEQLFAKLKARLRKAAARTREGLWSATASLIATISATECASYLRNCGYGPT